MFGYHGKFLNVDLNARETRTLELEADVLKKFIGGASLAARLIYDRVTANMDPLAPDSPLVFASGPFTGTTIPMVSRSAVCGISPLTGMWGEATTGGVFPFRLKASGFDGIFITGKADRPVYLYINKGNAEIRDASHLWGKDIYQTQEMLKDELKDTRLSVSCIGPAGENLVKYACVLNDRGRWRISFSANLSQEIVSALYLRIGVVEEYDSEPPSATAHKNDFSFTTSLGWTY